MLFSVQPRLKQSVKYIQSSFAKRSQWTKASLHKMKKNDLLRLAKENHLKISGTKNDMIVQLLTHQTAKIVGTSTPTLHSIRKTIQKDSGKEAEKLLQSKHQIQERKSVATEGATEKNDVGKGDSEGKDTPIDMDWVNAFDIKLGQRSSRFASLSKPSKEQRASRQIGINKELEKTLQHPPSSDAQSKSAQSDTILVHEVPSAPSVNADNVTQSDLQELADMDQEWVKAFEMKVESRGARQRHQVGDTLSIKAGTPSPSKSSTASSSGSTTMADKKVIRAPTASETEIPPLDDNTKKNSNNTFISAAIGSSMLIWYFGGGEGFSRIWHFFM
ncbi:hypothetical protein BDF20DRAFT_80572 [Mycotypha africana]|uniref:uncharacterized protein n=1 Tax=Mycotypha africana TaxID=64632 RepID=UPI002301A455|nr:uncharacterized protein BDF20DRAFT_80572 [Mycotypha africana]KAI8991994.1 hypothetical protein BDF20DRAFT_80572 [Mycotypha africana]